MWVEGKIKGKDIPQYTFIVDGERSILGAEFHPGMFASHGPELSQTFLNPAKLRLRLTLEDEVILGFRLYDDREVAAVYQRRIDKNQEDIDRMHERRDQIRTDLDTVLRRTCMRLGIPYDESYLELTSSEADRIGIPSPLSSLKGVVASRIEDLYRLISFSVTSLQQGSVENLGRYNNHLSS